MVSWFQEGRQKPFSRTVYWKLGDAHHRRGGHVNMHPDPTPVKPKVGVDEQASAAEKADFEHLKCEFCLATWYLDLCIAQVRFNVVEMKNLGCPLFLSATLFFMSATALVNSGKWNSE